MKILHVVPSYLPAVRYGGPIYSVHGLCRALVGLGHEVHVFTTSVDGETDSEVALAEAVDVDGVAVWYFPSKRLRRLYYAPAMQAMLAQQMQDFDLVHLHSVFLWPTWAAARAARRAGVPYVLSPRGMLVKDLIRRKSRWLKTAWIRLIEKKNIEKAAAVHVTSKREAADLAEFDFCLPNVWNIANGIDSPGSWAKDGLSRDVRAITAAGDYVFFLGRLNWKKGLDRLINAWADVPETRLVIAGNDEDDYLAELRNLAVASGCADRIDFLPRFITGQDKEDLFAAAHLFVLPSYSENFGMTVLEAMIRAVPVVVTPEVGAAEVVREVQGGLVIDGSPAELAKAINELLISPHKRELMGEMASNLVTDRYSWQGIGRQMEGEYQQLVGSELRGQ